MLVLSVPVHWWKSTDSSAAEKALQQAIPDVSPGQFWLHRRPARVDIDQQPWSFSKRIWPSRQDQRRSSSLLSTRSKSAFFRRRLLRDALAISPVHVSDPKQKNEGGQTAIAQN